VAELEKLAKLRNNKVLTQEEFLKQKQELLDNTREDKKK